MGCHQKRIARDVLKIAWLGTQTWPGNPQTNSAHMCHQKKDKPMTSKIWGILDARAFQEQWG